MSFLVRSWNVFHGNTDPPGRRGLLRAMVELASADGPDVLCLQELPSWALPRLARWSGMTVRSAVARRPWLPAWLAGAITRLNQGLLRSAISGQANAILLRPGLEPLEHAVLPVSEGRRERRVCHAVRLEGGLVVGNVHASNDFVHPEVPAAEIARAERFVAGLAAGGRWVLAGDFNLRGDGLPGPGIDHIVVHAMPAGPLEVWPDERRTIGGRVLSDHAPVERRVG